MQATLAYILLNPDIVLGQTNSISFMKKIHCEIIASINLMKVSFTTIVDHPIKNFSNIEVANNYKQS